jgi:Uma2 family endonuclease
MHTADDLWELMKLPEYQDRNIELIDGKFVEIPPVWAVPSMVTANFSCRLSEFVHQAKLGYVAANAGFELSPYNVIGPDVSFVSKSRVSVLPERFFEGAPDLAAEVVCPPDQVRAFQRRVAKYLAYGTRLAWIVYTDEKTVDVCRPSEHGISIEEIGIDGALDGGDVLPGFTLPVKDIFEGIA